MKSPDAIDLDRPRSIGDILSGALGLYRRYPWLFAILALGVIAPYDLAVLAVTGSGPLATGSHQNTEGYLLLMLLNLSLVGPLISALHVHAVVRIGEGSRPRAGEVAARGLQVLPVVVAAEVMATLGIALGFLALIVPGVLLSLRWAVVAQAAAIEQEGWLPALRRSGHLTRGHYWRIFGLLLLTGLLTAGLMRGAAAIPLGSSAGAGSVALGIVVHTLTASFAALTFALLYFDLRVRMAQPAARSTPEYQYLRDLD
ncbi:MAG TPA: hypothetical protein VGY76_06760 [Solirubrobacteraceae bacterium]|jgi:hypothetical protein|nr:hypothetical protein [Solirubrobacteraceae bacterium]